jgi:peptidoglycan/xylan/chitin deacetylase (PgdA/CDA1 family)
MRYRGCVSLVFDDGYEQILRKVVPLLRQMRLPATFAVVVEPENLVRETGRPIAPAKEWLSLRAEGFEIASHSVTHPDLRTLSHAELVHELVASQKTLGAKTFVYPGGAFNERVLQAVRHTYRAARTVKRGLETLPPRNPWCLRAYNFTRPRFSARRANLLAIYAALRGRWLIETYHMILPARAPRRLPLDKRYAIDEEEFREHLRFLARRRIPVRTIAQVTQLK